MAELNPTQYTYLTQLDIAFYADEERLRAYGHDETEDLVFPPELVLVPKSAEDISKILTYCHAEGIAVTPAGARTGLSGGCLPIHGGVLVSMEKFNRILHIDTDNLQVITEPGVITEVLQESVKRTFWIL